MFELCNEPAGELDLTDRHRLDPDTLRRQIGQRAGKPIPESGPALAGQPLPELDERQGDGQQPTEQNPIEPKTGARHALRITPPRAGGSGDGCVLDFAVGHEERSGPAFEGLFEAVLVGDQDLLAGRFDEIH